MKKYLIIETWSSHPHRESVNNGTDIEYGEVKNRLEVNYTIYKRPFLTGHRILLVTRKGNWYGEDAPYIFTQTNREKALRECGIICERIDESGGKMNNVEFCKKLNERTLSYYEENPAPDYPHLPYGRYKLPRIKYKIKEYVNRYGSVEFYVYRRFLFFWHLSTYYHNGQNHKSIFNNRDDAINSGTNCIVHKGSNILSIDESISITQIYWH